ncbi:uncharacterized protein LOC117411248 [Acipenser ruthenus]|uniref:uncharacterized protein LOC117411248 n=1 Tax=Acipenser ruthenus TaxID=7906 RepID=UPI00274294CA|nr:uncharacterized protein LOC117411248 [Acipenser ruthenus]
MEKVKRATMNKAEKKGGKGVLDVGSEGTEGGTANLTVVEEQRGIKSQYRGCAELRDLSDRGRVAPVSSDRGRAAPVSSDRRRAAPVSRDRKLPAAPASTARGRLPAATSQGSPPKERLGLPSLHSLGLPSLQRLGLPSLQRLGLPSLQHLGLPSLKRLGLPSLHSLGLPSLQRLGLPSLKCLGLPSRQHLGLPSLKCLGLPSRQHLGRAARHRLGGLARHRLVILVHYRPGRPAPHCPGIPARHHSRICCIQQPEILGQGPKRRESLATEKGERTIGGPRIQSGLREPSFCPAERQLSFITKAEIADT